MGGYNHRFIFRELRFVSRQLESTHIIAGSQCFQIYPLYKYVYIETQPTKYYINHTTMTEKLCLRWNDFQENVNSAFRNLREDSDLADVTLVCGDGQQIEAHRVILASSSPFFKGLFKRNRHANQLVYMRGVLYEDFVAILDFLYYGEANVYQEHLTSFLAIAEDLKLKGLVNENGGIEVKEEGRESFELKSDPLGSKLNSKAQATPKSGDFEELNQQVKSMMKKSKNHLPRRNDGQGDGFASVCKVCEKEGTATDIKRHIEANHLEGISLPCNLCENIFKSRRNLARHKLKDHMH